MSYLKIVTAEIEKAKSTILDISHISRDIYTELMFAHGSMFAEQFCRTHYLDSDAKYQELTQDPKLGFWKWWQFQYGKDDLLLVKRNCLHAAHDYEHMKSCMVGDQFLEKDLLSFLTPKI